jgi:hypothetical protein
MEREQFVAVDTAPWWLLQPDVGEPLEELRRRPGASFGWIDPMNDPSERDLEPPTNLEDGFEADRKLAAILEGDPARALSVTLRSTSEEDRPMSSLNAPISCLPPAPFGHRDGPLSVAAPPFRLRCSWQLAVDGEGSRRLVSRWVQVPA